MLLSTLPKGLLAASLICLPCLQTCYGYSLPITIKPALSAHYSMPQNSCLPLRLVHASIPGVQPVQFVQPVHDRRKMVMLSEAFPVLTRGLAPCSFVQGLVFRTEGAVGVALVNAIRGGTVSLLMGTLFCSSATPARCLHRWSGASAAVQTAGGLTWLTAGRKVQLVLCSENQCMLPQYCFCKQHCCCDL